MYSLFANTKRYRLHPKEDEEKKNIPSRREVLRIVLIQQSVQITINLLLFMFMHDESATKKPELPLVIRAGQFLVGMAILDTHQYFVHRYLHVNKFLYKHFHSKHHKIIVSYPYAALYADPFEGFVIDTVGGALACLLTGMSPATAAFFFSIGTMKTVDDHCGFMLPWHPLHVFFENNSAFHDVHHQLYGNKYNYGQMFSVTWDKIMGTYMPYSVEKREDGGLVSRPILKKDR